MKFLAMDVNNTLVHSVTEIVKNASNIIPTQDIAGLTYHQSYDQKWSSNFSFQNNISLNSTIPDLLHTYQPEMKKRQSLLQLTIVSILSTLVSIAIITCNVLVFLSFKINKKLHTVSNLFILSLAASDLMVGLFSTNLYTMYLLLEYWPLGSFVCDLWLSIDYACCQASVFNLVVICVDRYLNLKKPFSHKVNRTASKARIAICMVWVGSLLIWAPLIISYQFIVGERTVPGNKCYVQFLSDSIPITLVTGMITFYIPVVTMVILYFKIYRLTTDRIRDFALMTLQFHIGSSADYLNNETKRGKLKRRSSEEPSCNRRSIDLKMVKRAKLDQFMTQDDDPESANETQRLTSCNGPLPKRKQGIVDGGACSTQAQKSKTKTLLDTDTQESKAKRFTRKKSSSFDYSGLRFPSPGGPLGKPRSSSGGSKDLEPPSRVRKKSCSVDFTGMRVIYLKDTGKKSHTFTTRNREDSLFGRRDTLFSRRNTILTRRGSVGRHRKAAKMVIFLLLAFISTWLMYNVLALIKPFCFECIPHYLWTVSNWLCYVNSLINPFCYAFGNKEFRQSFRSLVGLGRRKLNKKLKI